jgi:hypothetical protein
MTYEYWNKDITISLYDYNNKLTDYNLEVWSLKFYIIINII